MDWVKGLALLAFWAFSVLGMFAVLHKNCKPSQWQFMHKTLYLHGVTCNKNAGFSTRQIQHS